MNARLAPEHYVANESFIFWVDGFTSDDPRDWSLSVAERDFNGTAAMATAKPAIDVEHWEATPWQHRVVTDEDVSKLTFMVGNMQRALKGIPVVKATSR